MRTYLRIGAIIEGDICSSPSSYNVSSLSLIVVEFVVESFVVVSLL